MTGWGDPRNDDPSEYRRCMVCGTWNPRRPEGCGPHCNKEDTK